jgi:hypothetical protein
MLPSAWNDYSRKAELGATWCLGKEAGPSNPLRRGIATYLHAAGIQAGYSFLHPTFQPSTDSRWSCFTKTDA